MATLTLFSFPEMHGGNIVGSVFAQEPNSVGIAPATPPIRISTPSGTYTVELDWQPESASVDQETIYLVRFLDETGQVLTSSRISYDFEIFSSEGSLIEGLYGQETEDDGIGRPLIFEFEAVGPISITVYAHSTLDVSSGDVNPIDEEVTFTMIVVPEFSVSVVLIAAPTMIGLVLLLNRLRFHALENTRR